MVRISPSKDRSCRLNVENEAVMWPKSFISNCLSESSSDMGGGRINKVVPLNRDAIGLNLLPTSGPIKILTGVSVTPKETE